MSNETVTLSFWDKVKAKLPLIFNVLIPVVLLFMIVSSFTLSIVSYSRSVKTSKEVVELTKLIEQQNKSITNSLNAIEAHVMFIEKYAEKSYVHFYGDVGRVNVKEKNNSTKVE